MPKIKKQWEVRYFVTAVASVPLYKCHSKTETYKQAAKPGWGTVEWYSAADGYKNPVARDRSDKTQQLYCDEDCSASLYTKNGGYFGIFPYEEINVSEMPKQADCAAIITSDADGFSVWAEDFSKVHIFVTYDENGLIDNYRVEYDDTTIYDSEVEISFDNLYERAEEDFRENYREEIPGTVEYSFKREADKLAQESGETWMNAEEREEFRRVCHKIDRIKSARDFLCIMQLLEYDHDKKIINAARKFKKCFNFAQYEQPKEAARREELLEDYEKYAFTMEDTTDTAEDSQQDATGAATTVVPEAGNRQDQPQAQEINAGKRCAETRQKTGGGPGPPPQEKEEQEGTAVRQYKYITFADRKQIATWYREGERPADIANRLGVSTKTVYLELKRGETVGEDGAPVLDRNQRRAYNPVIAQQMVQANFRRRGRTTADSRKGGGESDTV